MTLLDNNFLNKTPKTKRDKWKYIKLKNFHASEGTINRVNRQVIYRTGENITKCRHDKELMSRIYFKIPAKKPQITQLKNGQRT